MRPFLFVLLIINVLNCKPQGVENKYPYAIDSITNKKVYLVVNERPEFLGKEGDILNYIYKNFRDSTMTGVQFSIKLRFVIDSKGNLIGAGLLNKDQNYKEEVKIVNIVKTSPKWKPGKYLKKRVNVLMIIKFSGVINESGRLDRVWTTGFICPRNLHEK